MIPVPLRNRDRKGAAPTTYLITFVCYGTWLPGQAGVIPRTQNGFGTRLPDVDVAKTQWAKDQMTQAPYVLDAIRRQVVLRSIQEVCSFRQWTLLAAHVRTNHVHVVAAADCKPEQVMSAFKAYSSRALNQMGLDGADRRRWARHGSTQYLWTKDAVAAAIDYVVHEQGDAMAVFEVSAAR